MNPHLRRTAAGLAAAAASIGLMAAVATPAQAVGTGTISSNSAGAYIRAQPYANATQYG